jgi:DNA-binding XRE family transcriptional regulator
MWEMSAVINARRQDHPISPSTISDTSRRGDASCQHALIMLRWLNCAPEDFIAEPHPATVGVPLPAADAAHRLRWNLRALYNALNDARRKRGASWQETAQRLHCTPHQLTGLRTAKFATSMRLAMRICQALRRPSADFIYVADW